MTISDGIDFRKFVIQNGFGLVGNSSMKQKTDLTSNICDCKLSGAIDGTQILAHAVSGGRAGSKTDGAVNELIANNPFTYKMKLEHGGVGGVLPITEYVLRTHEDRVKRPNWIRLVPLHPEKMANRNGMAIHGRGPRGSDGCIVPTDFNIVIKIYNLVDSMEKAGKSGPTLAVVAIGDLEYYIERLGKAKKNSIKYCQNQNYITRKAILIRV